MIVTVFASNILGDGLPSNALSIGMHNNYNSCYDVVCYNIDLLPIQRHQTCYFMLFLRHPKAAFCVDLSKEIIFKESHA